MKRIFDSEKDCELYKAVGDQAAIVDRRAYSFIEGEIFWPGFKKYLKERFNFDYTPSLEAIDYHEYAGAFQATLDHYVAFEGRVLFWKVTNAFLEPDVWELDAAELAACMRDWAKLRRFSLLDLVRWFLKKKGDELFMQSLLTLYTA